MKSLPTGMTTILTEGATERIALRVIDAQVSQLPQDNIVFHELGDRLFPHDVCDFIDGSHYREISDAFDNAFDKRAVDLEEIDR